LIGELHEHEQQQEHEQQPLAGASTVEVVVREITSIFILPSPPFQRYF